MNNRSRLWRIAVGSLILGASAAIAVSPLSVPANATARHPHISDSKADVHGGAHDEAKQSEKRRHKRFFLIEDSAAIIGIDKSELIKQLKGGKSIAEVAQAKGIREDVLIEKLLAARLQKMDEAVKSGKWPQEKADRFKQKLPDHLKMMVNKKDWKEWQKDKEHKQNKDS